MLRSNLCDYSDPYIVAKGTINVTGTINAKRNKKNQQHIVHNAEDVDIIMPMYNLLEYSDNYSITSGCLWNYYRDEANNDENETDNNNNNNNNKKKKKKKINNNKKIRSKS